MFILYHFIRDPHDSWFPALKYTVSHNPFSDRISVSVAYANSADLVQTPQNAASDQGLHCLVTGISMQNTVKVKIFTGHPKNYKWTRPNDKDRLDKSTSQKRVKLFSIRTDWFEQTVQTANSSCRRPGFCRTCSCKVRYRRPVFCPSVSPSVRLSVHNLRRPYIAFESIQMTYSLKSLHP